ncbi:MAG: YitT family protein, partial [Pyramidobacter sp.]|nr:YitT family protein [Pyramidobacter sp.]
MTPRAQKRALHWAKLLFFLVLGNTMLAFGVCAFVMPHRFMLGGATGIALFLQNFLPLRLSVLSAILNAGFFLLGLVMIGREFAATTIFSTAFFPLVLAVFEQVPWAT